MMLSFRRIAVAVLLALPGIGLATIAKPLILGERVLLLGILLALVVPVGWLVVARAPPAGGEPSEGTGGRA